MNPRLLLIDDDPDYCEVIGRMLSGRFDVCFARTIGEGVACMTEREPDAVLLDLTLPDSSDTPQKTLARVKLHRKHAAIVVLSGNSNPDIIYDLISANASGYLVKLRDDLKAETMAGEINKAIESQRFCADKIQKKSQIAQQ